MRRGQASQIFIYVVAIVIFSLILLYGYNAVSGFRERADQIAFIKFKTDLTSTVKRIAPDYGTVRKEEFFIGGKYTRVCFVQTHKAEDAIIRQQITVKIIDPIVEDSFSDNVDKNVFLFSSSLQESFSVGKIEVDDYYLCAAVTNGRIKIQLEGKGDHAYISSYL